MYAVGCGDQEKEHTYKEYKSHNEQCDPCHREVRGKTATEMKPVRNFHIITAANLTVSRLTAGKYVLDEIFPV